MQLTVIAFNAAITACERASRWQPALQLLSDAEKLADSDAPCTEVQSMPAFTRNSVISSIFSCHTNNRAPLPAPFVLYLIIRW